MAYEKKEGDISIFKNEKTSEKQPDYRGTALVDGKEKEVSLWIREGAKGKFFSGQIKDKWVKPEETTEKSSEAHDDLGKDDLPF